MTKNRWVAAALGAGILALLAISRAMACSCAAPDQSPAGGDRAVQYVDLAADAKVVGFRKNAACVVDNPSFPCVNLDAVELSIITPYKGNSGKSVEVVLDRDCATSLVAGSTQFIVAQEMPSNEGTKPQYRTNSCALDQWADRWSQMRFRDYRQNWDELRDRVSASPSDPDAWLALASFLETWRDYRSALDAYRRLADLRPAEGAAAMGRILFYLNDPEATAALESAFALRPNDAQLSGLLALAYARDHVPPNKRKQLDGAFDFRGLDLSNFQFADLDLRGADFRAADLRIANFQGVNLSGANFHGLDLTNVFMEHVTLDGADLTDSVLGYGPTLSAQHAKLRGAYTDVAAFLLPDAPSIADFNLSGTHIRCPAAPNPEGRDAFTGDWAGYTDELEMAKRLLAAQPAVDLGRACVAGLESYLEPSVDTARCAPWVNETNRPPECEIDGDR